jgi:hypothetical protein
MCVAEADHEHGHEAEKDAGAREGKGQWQYRAARNVGTLSQATCRCSNDADSW